VAKPERAARPLNGEYREILARLGALQDAAGRDKAPEIPLIDPTANVLSLVGAAMLRQDDLRKAESKRINDLRKAAGKHSREVDTLREKAQRDLAAAESRRLDALSLAESRRIDALLVAAENARALATTRSELTAAALAERVDTSAKTLAAAVDATAKTLAATVEATAKTLASRIEPLEQARYEQAGGKEQRSEGRQTNQWVVGLVMAAPSTLMALVLLILLLARAPSA
jgi:hypothetical protein